MTLLFEVSLPHLPLHLERRIHLDRADPSVLRIQERVTNAGHESIPIEWGQHIAFGAPFLSEACTFEVPALPQGENAWSGRDADGRDLRRVLGPDAHTEDFGIFEGFSDGWYRIINHVLNVGVDVKWDVALLLCLWLWPEFQRSSGHPFYGWCYVMGLEPCSTNTHAGIAESVRHHTPCSTA